MHNNKVAIIWMFVQTIVAALMFIVGKLIETKYSVFQLIFLYHAISFCFILSYAVIKNCAIKFHCFSSHIARTLFTILGYVLYFTGIQYISLTAATAISYSLPFFMIIMGMIFYKEKLTIARIVSLIAGFVGMVIIVRPESGVINIGDMMVTGCVLSWSIANLFIKKLGNSKINLFNQLFHYYFLGTLIILPFAIFNWYNLTFVNMIDIFWLLVIALISVLLVVSLSKAFTLGDFALVMPVDYLRLPFTTIFAYIIFSEVPQNNTIIGSLIIILANLYLMKKEAIKKS